MKEQSYANHTRYVMGFHIILSGLLLIGTILSLVNIWVQCAAGNGIMNPILITLLFICGLFLFWFTRQFAVTVQDRAIRAEENLRYLILAGKRIDSKVTVAQLIALRFAHDDEFVALADRAAKEELSPVEIKKAIKQWRADHHLA
jgi:hypothetical protein